MGVTFLSWRRILRKNEVVVVFAKSDYFWFESVTHHVPYDWTMFARVLVGVIVYIYGFCFAIAKSKVELDSFEISFSRRNHISPFLETERSN